MIPDGRTGIAPGEVIDGRYVLDRKIYYWTVVFFGNAQPHQ